jgi:hypothetical protein
MEYSLEHHYLFKESNKGCQMAREANGSLALSFWLKAGMPGLCLSSRG